MDTDKNDVDTLLETCVILSEHDFAKSPLNSRPDCFFIRYGFNARHSKYTTEVDWSTLTDSNPQTHLAALKKVFADATESTARAKRKRADSVSIKSEAKPKRVKKEDVVKSQSAKKTPDDGLSSPTKSPRKSPTKSQPPAQPIRTSPRKKKSAPLDGLGDVIVVEDENENENERAGNFNGVQSTPDLEQVAAATITHEPQYGDLETTAAAFAAVVNHQNLPSQDSKSRQLIQNSNSASILGQNFDFGEIPIDLSNLQLQHPHAAQTVQKVSMKSRKAFFKNTRKIVVKAPVSNVKLPNKKSLTDSVASEPQRSSFNPSSHSKARALLHVSAVPDALPCRDREFSQLFIALEGAIKSGTGSCIYVSGTPGTGKTATVREVLAQLHLRINDGSPNALPTFTSLEINGLKLINPQEAYEVLWQHITEQRVSAQNAVGLLEREFKTNREDVSLAKEASSNGNKTDKTSARGRTGRATADELVPNSTNTALDRRTRSGPPTQRRKRNTVVVVMDELDQLVTKNQNIVYNFFNWPSLPHSKLIVIAIANTMDLPERTFTNKISSRLGLTRFIFPGYSYEQLQEIISSRLVNYSSLIQKEAIEFAARKVASVSGDARRALDICRRAFEIAEQEGETDGNKDSTSSGLVKNETALTKNTVKIKHIKEAIDETTSSPMAIYLQGLPMASKIFLSAVLARVRRNGINENPMSDILEETQRLCKVSPQADKLLDVLFRYPGSSTGKRIRMAGFLSTVAELVESGIIVQQSIKGERNARVRLAIAEDEIKTAFKGDLDVEGMI